MHFGGRAFMLPSPRRRTRQVRLPVYCPRRRIVAPIGSRAKNPTSIFSHRSAREIRI
jgi:hypothetical protein